MLDSERTFKTKVRLRWKLSKFFLLQQLFTFKDFAWKRDCPISSKLQTSRTLQRSFKKSLIEFYK